MKAISGTSKVILGAAMLAAMLGACKKNETGMTRNDATTSPSTTSGTSGSSGSSGAGTGTGTATGTGTMTTPSDTPYTAPAPATTPETTPPARTDGTSGTGTATPPK